MRRPYSTQLFVMSFSGLRAPQLSDLALIPILLLAAALRFGFPGLHSFGFDEARLSLIALDMARGGTFATLGMPSSAGVPNLPASAWLFALPYALSTNPQIATWFVGIVSLLTVVGVWALARRAWGGWAGLAAALFMAAAPFSVLYARSIWAQNLLPALGFLWLWSACEAVKGRRAWAVALHVFVAGFAFQVHLAGAALALGTVYVVLRWRWWRHWRAVLAGGALALVCLAPFTLELLRQPELLEHFMNAAGGANPDGHPTRISLESTQALLRLALNRDWAFLAAGDWPDLDDAPNLLGAVMLIPLALGLAAAIRFTFQSRAASPPNPLSALSGLPLVASREGEQMQGESSDSPSPSMERGRRGEAILAELTLVLLLAPLLLFLRHSAPVFVHYLLPALPALALVVGASAMLAGRGRIGQVWGALMTVIMAAVTWGMAGQVNAGLDAASRFNWGGSGLGTPLRVMQQAANSVPADTPVLFFTHGDDPNVDGEAAAFSVLWWGRDYRIIDGEVMLVLPPYPATLMATLAPFQAWEELEASGLVREVQEFPRLPIDLPFVATTYDGATPPRGFTPVDPIPFEDGATLEGWRVRRVGERLRVSTLWRVEGAPPPATIQQFHHLYQGGETGEPFAVSDVPVSAHTWQVGDRLVVMGDFFDVPPGEYRLVVGHYTLPDVTRIPRMDGGDSAELGTLVWSDEG